MVRVAVIDYELCKPHRCRTECVRFCPVNRSGGKAIELSESVGGKALIYEVACVGCGICVKKCPFNAITVVNLPDELEKRLVHRYGQNAFKLYGLPTPQEGMVIGVLGKNGSGKTTVLRILSGELIPNFGDFNESPSWEKVLERFRGTELHQYFRRVSNKELKVIHKIQHVDLIRRYVKGYVKEVLEKYDERGLLNDVRKILSLDSAWDNKIANLSGGELQKFAIAVAILREARAYFFDEPSSYLDVKERLAMARAIRELLPKNSYVVVVEHDLAVLDYVSDNVVIMYGEPGVYGFCSKLYSVGSGINHFLEGYLPAENMRIRDEPIIFQSKPPAEVSTVKKEFLYWPKLIKSLNGFKLTVEEGFSYMGEVLGILGPNAIGKTTFIRLLAGELQPDEGFVTTEGLKISYKPQYIKAETYEWRTVEEALKELRKEGLAATEWFEVDVVRKLGLHKLGDKEIASLSGGELQKFAIFVSLAKEADIYLIDEPSAFIDVEERLTVAKAIKKVCEVRRTTVFLVDHDVSLISYVADRMIVFNGTPGKEGHARSPTDVRAGMNEFLKNLQTTFRRDLKTGRPRVNKPGSYLDRYQKSIGEYYFIEAGAGGQQVSEEK